ncbi:MAG: YbaL family putative K(+) efflux transporter [Gammaproteobacteria bacterium]
MPHEVTLIATIAAAFGLSMVFGFMAVRLGLPVLLGYLIAGVIIGPSTPGFVADVSLAQQLAEIGVMLLMFGVGLHFSLEDLLAVRKIAVPGAIVQIVVATALGAGVATLWGWNLGAAVVFGLALSVASTVVLLRALENRGALETLNGHIAVGWLIVEDLAMVLVLVLLPAFAAWLGGAPAVEAEAPARGLGLTLAITLGQVAVFVALMLLLGKRLVPWVLSQVARTGSRELFTLTVITAAVGIAFGAAALFGVSFALGAFFAGMVMRESELSHRAANETLPLRDAFAVLFFVSVGMLFDPRMLLMEPLRVLTVVGIIVVGKTLAAFAIVLAFRYPLNTALTVSASLAQIGEFSFILAGLGVSLKLLPVEGQNLILAGALISIALNPLLFGGVKPAVAWIRSRSRLARYMERPTDALAKLPTDVPSNRLAGHVLIVGFGRVGERIGTALIERGISIVVIEQNRDTVERLRKRGIPAVSGDAADTAVLKRTHVTGARLIVIAISDALQARTIAEHARTVQPNIEIVVRAHTDDDAAVLRKDRGNHVFVGEHELALGMTRQVVESMENN